MNQSQMLKGILEGCVLQILNKEECYSQEIVDKLKGKGFENISEGTLFPMLLRLDKEQLFDTRKVPSALGPDRKYYKLNEKGKAELNEFRNEWHELKGIVDSILEEDINDHK